MLKRILAMTGVLAVIAIALIVNLTSPSDVGPLLVLVLLFAIYIVTVNIGWLGLRLVFGKKMAGNKGIRYGLVIGFTPILAVLAHGFVGGWIGGIVLSCVIVGMMCLLVSKL